mgnify:CR=1 FL=1
MREILFLLLPVAAFSGWIIGRRALANNTFKRLTNLNKLFDTSSNKTVDVLVQLMDANQEAVETHLALGGLFRRRGEVDKAIGIHQNLLDKPSLTNEQRALSLLELSRDYMRAGVLDRAENVLLDLVDQGYELDAAFQHLLDIYQQIKRRLFPEEFGSNPRRDLLQLVYKFPLDLQE